MSRPPASGAEAAAAVAAAAAAAAAAQRFENAFGGKIQRHVRFEERLSLAPHMSKTALVSCCTTFLFKREVFWEEFETGRK